MDIGSSIERGFDQFFAWIPNLVGAIVILLVGWIVARIVGSLVTKALRSVDLDRHMTSGSVGSYVEQVTASPAAAIGRIVYWLTLLGAFSLAVTALGLPALTAFVAAIYGYMPHVLAALAIFVVASLLATAVGGVVHRLMGDTPTGKVVRAVAPTLIMVVASFMVLTELQIAETIVVITYTALVGSTALALALAFGLGGREAASSLLDTAVQKGSEQGDQVKRDLQVGKARGEARADEVASDGRRRFVRSEESAPDPTKPHTVR